MKNIEISRRRLCQIITAAALPAQALRAQSDDPFQPVRALLSGTQAVTWLFTGDSITHGALHTVGWS
ncbi:MAG: hypothetical protein ABIZ80_10160, partial [Bryobacteraceae bacterium]